MTTPIRFTALGCIAAGCALFHGCASDPAPPPAAPALYIPAATLTAPVLPEAHAYVVQKGDTLSEILKKTDSRLSDVLALNATLKPNSIYVGQTILLPPSAKTAGLSQPTVKKPTVTVKDGGNTVYTVVKGDSLSVIAQRFGIKTQALREANELKTDTIRIGQKLVIPAK